MLQKVRNTLLKSFQILIVQVCLRNAAIVLQRTNGRYDDNCARLQSRHTALDVEEFLSTEVCTKACLCDRIITKLQSHLRCDNGVTSMCDVCERSAVYDRRNMLQCLYEIRLQGILQKCTHCAFCMKVTCGNRLLLGNFSVCISNNDICQTLLQVCNVICQAKDCHDLRCNRDIVAILSRHTVGLSAKSVYYKTKLTVIHIHTSSPGDLSRVDVQLVALVNMVVDHCCKKVICCADRMEVTGKVQVDILHRNNLCISAACCSALYAEYRSEGRLTKRYHNIFTKLLHTICQTYRCGRLSFSCRSWVDRRYENQLSVWLIRFI